MNENGVTLSYSDYALLFNAAENHAYDLLVGKSQERLLALFERLPKPWDQQS